MRKPVVFTDDDIQTMRTSLNSRRVPGSYEPGKWSVSQWNRDESVVGVLPKSIQLRDITLRTVEEMSGVMLTKGERAELLSAIAETGVSAIGPSTFRRGHDDDMAAEAAIVRAINPHCQLVYGAVSSEDELKMAADAGYDAVEVWSTFLGAAAPSCAGPVYHRAWQDRDWRSLNFPKRPEDQIERSVRFVELGKKHGINVFGAVNLLAYSEVSYIRDYCKVVSEAGSPDITLADGSSGVGPEAMGYLVRVACEAAPTASIAVHAHNTFGLAMACCVEAVKAGASVIEVAVNELEEAPGQPDLAVAAVTFEALYGIETGIDLSRLYPLARLAERLVGYRVQWNHPVTGASVFGLRGGDEFIQETYVDPMIHSSITAELVGTANHLGIGPTTGPFTLWDKLESLGFEVDSKRVIDTALEKCKEAIRDLKRPLSDDEILQFAEQAAEVGV
jgi:isopropylmalate/homocitrate/citramalate synthase